MVDDREEWENSVVRITDDMKAHITAYVSGAVSPGGDDHELDAGDLAMLNYCDWAGCDGSSDAHITMLVGARVAVVLMKLIEAWTEFEPDRVWRAYLEIIAAKKEGLT